MAYDTGFSRRSSSERDLQPVAIVSIDPTSRVAVGATRTRHTIRINCAYATGDTITVPAVGEQWYVERFDAEWRLYGRIPFNDPTLNIEPEEGQVSVGSASGPLELNGTEVRANGTFRLDGVYFRDTGTQFERSTDKKTWTAIGGGAAGMVQIIAEALAHYTGTDQALATAALKSWGGGLDKVAENFTLLWDLLCGNVFVSGLKRLGVGASDVERIIDGFQNFVNYLFGVVFCDFTGDLDPQTILARLRDLLGPIISNPFVQGLAAVATALGVGTGNLLQNVVTGLTGLLELVFNIVTCRWDKLDLTHLGAVAELFNADGPFSPATIVDFLKRIFIDPVIDLETRVLTPIIGTFLDGLKQIADLITGALTGRTFDSLLEGVVQGVQDVLQLIYDTVTQILSGQFPTRIADILGISALIVEGFPFSPANLVKSVTDFFILLFSRTLDAEGTVNPVGAIFNGLADAWKAVAALFGFDDAGSVFKNALYGVSEFVSILHDLFLVNPFDEGSRTMFTSAIGKITAIVAEADPSSLIINILNVVGRVFQAVIDNPVSQIIREFLTLFGIPVTNEDLFTQIFQGFESAFNTVMKIITEVLIPLGHDNWQTLIPFIPATVWNGIWSATLPEFPVPDFLTTIGDLVAGAGSAITTLLENLLALFGIDFTPTDAEGNPLPFNAANAITDFIFKIFSGESLNTFLSVAFGGVFGSTLTEVSRFFNRIINMFGLTLSSFTDIASFNFVAAASGFINNVLVNAPAVAIQTFQSFFTIAGTLVYDMAQGIIEVISKVPLFGPPVAGTLTALLNAFVGGQRGYVNSGSNLLIDPGVENASFWKQSGSSRETAPKRSAGGSLFVSGGTYVWFNVNDLGEVSPISTRPDEVMHAECYVYSYYYTTVYMYARATDSTTGTYQDYYIGYGSVGPGGWTKVTGDVRIPSPWDRIQYGIYTVGGYPVYIDDMLVREVTDANTVSNTVTNLNSAIYGTNTAPTPGYTLIPPTRVQSPTGSGTVSGDIGSVYNTLTGNTSGTGNGGLVATVGNASSGLVNKTNTIVTSTFNAWYGSGSSGTASEMGQVIGSIKTTVSNTWTVEVLPYGTTTWTRPVPTAQILEFWVICVGSGGGGGKGQVGYPGQTNPGGNGGLGGKWFAKQLNPSILPATVNVGIGAGGAGKTSGTVDAANNRADTRFGYGYEAHSVTTGEIQTASVASIISFYAATDSQPGDGGTGATGNGSGVQAGFGESTPLATGGLGGLSAGGGGGSGSVGGAGGDANNLGQLRAGGGGGGGGGAGTYQNGGNGGSGGVPGGGGGGGGGSWASGGPVGGNGGTGGNGCIILLYRKSS